MKKSVSVLVAVIAALLISVTALASEDPMKLFEVDPKEGFSAEEVFSYAKENGFDGILLDYTDKRSADFYDEFSALSGDGLTVYFLADENCAKDLAPGSRIVFRSGVSEETISSFSGEKVSLLLPFDDKKALSDAKYFYEKGYFKTVFAENLLSCNSESGYEDYLLKIAAEFPKAEIITLNSLGRILVPSVKGDFYSDPFELNNQYLVNKINGFGFCVSDYSDLRDNVGGRAKFLTEYFNSTVLDEYGVFSISEKLEITRPVKEKLVVGTEKYTIFGTSDPEKPLYMNGEEIERISKSGVFAVTAEIPIKGKTFTFTQDGASDSVTITRTPEETSAGKTTKLTSCAPTGAKIIEPGATEVKISCVGPSGAKITAKIGEKTATLTQDAYAEKGVPAKYSGKINLSGEYPEDEVTLIGNVTYTLNYNGNTTTYESAGSYYYLAENAKLAIRATVELAGVENEPGDNGNYVTTLRTGCTDYVTEIAENGWYKITCGGYIKPSQCEIITGKVDIQTDILSVTREIGENYEKLIFSCSEIPSFKGEISGSTFSITLSNTNWSIFSSTDMASELMYRFNPVNNGDGTITVNFCSKKPLWGWDVFTDPENKTFSVVLKAKPTLSDDLSKPLSGITVTVCAGHGGPDPGALSVAGEKGVNEFQINLVNTLAIAEALEDLGAEVILLITQEEKLDTYGRTDPARYAYSDVYVCCHANAVAESSAANLWCGTYVYYHYDHSAEFSKKLCDYISASTNRDNEGAVQDYYSVTRLTMCPAVMLEVGFVSNPAELESLIDRRDIQKTAYAVTKAILEICDN